ncbi:MAG: delta-aminolevulinic acid dehydratase, partial [Phycisphaerales bacterium]|nr:delta-aminolevulinic acid dehydratase [Phycisphaerales bacterium]
MLQRVVLRRSDIIVPVFVCEGSGVKRPIGSMPGVFQMSVDVAADWLAERANAGFRAYLPFGVIDAAKKDATGSESIRESNVVCQIVRETKKRKIAMAAVTDLCLCEYTNHGHCGPLTDATSTSSGGDVDNDKTLALLAQQAVNHAKAGADVIAPSGMMDGMVAAIRKGLDDGGFPNIPILSYAVKYASAYYGPFRDAAESTPAFGDRRTYQMDPANGDEALREVALDIAEGADMVMVKPGMPYLDIVRQVVDAFSMPTFAFQVSGEYAMLMAAAQNGWIEEERAIMESLGAFKRA